MCLGKNATALSVIVLARAGGVEITMDVIIAYIDVNKQIFNPMNKVCFSHLPNQLPAFISDLFVRPELNAVH